MAVWRDVGRIETASVRYRAPQTFFRRAVAEGELEAIPMARPGDSEDASDCRVAGRLGRLGPPVVGEVNPLTKSQDRVRQSESPLGGAGREVDYGPLGRRHATV